MKLFLILIIPIAVVTSQQIRFPDGQDEVGYFSQLQNKLAELKKVFEPDLKQSIRLRGGQAPNQGYLEVHDAGKWLLVCDPNSQSWSIQQAQVACRELGYDEGASVTGGSLKFPGLRELLLETKRPPKPARIKCTGEEAKLKDCKWETEEYIQINNK